MNNNQGRRRVRRNRRQKKTQISRILLTICMMALVAVVSIGGTMAWLTDATQTVTNTFTKSDISITLTETDSDDTDTDANQNSYKMVPGTEIAKDPKVTYLANNEAGWLFVKVEKVNDPDNYLDYTINNQWNALGTAYPDVYYIENADTLDGTPDLYSVLTGDKVTVKSTVTKDMMETLTDANYPQLKFTAYAIQKAGFESAEDAWKEIIK